MDVRVLQASEGRRRVAIENVKPAIDCGQFPIKRTVGESITVSADVFADGHDVVRASLLSRQIGQSQWRSSAMTELGNDAWRADLPLDQLGRYQYTIVGWVDAFDTWLRDLKKRVEAGQDVTIDRQIGAQLVGQAAARADGDESAQLSVWQARLTSHKEAAGPLLPALEKLSALMKRHPDLSQSTQCPRPFEVVVDPVRARFSSWYELFPRSCAAEAGKHGTFRDVIAWLPRIAEMGFDVLYLPPVHPVGNAFRKGKNNATSAEPGDVGSPWAIGSTEGGHTSIHPELGTLADLRALIAAAGERGIDVALDIAFQCSPDHPYVADHPEWFRQRPDGTIQYAENPPKKYQDIYPFDFETTDWRALWEELTGVVLYWCQQGIRVFRVDNPHTKAFAFWEYLIGQVKTEYPGVIFLSEAFTRPKIMYRLAKLGFSQSYTYFTWRNTKAELMEYFTELTQSGVSEYFRPNLWPNTPDILPPHLQEGNRAAFVARLVLAGTLGASYGIYGPAFENLEHVPRDPGSEEYLNSEKYQLRQWDFSGPENLAGVIALVNRARRENAALQWDTGLRFHATDNEQLLCYSKQTPDRSNVIVSIVNLNFREAQHGFIVLPLDELGIDSGRPYQVQDLLNGGTFTWEGPRNFVDLDPAKSPAHILRLLPQT